MIILGCEMGVPPFKETPTSPHLKAVEFLLLLVQPQAWAHSQWPHSQWPHSLLLPGVVCSSASNEKMSKTSSNTFGETAGLGIETNIIQHDLYRMQAGKNMSMVVHLFLPYESKGSVWIFIMYKDESLDHDFTWYYYYYVNIWIYENIYWQ